MTDLPAGRELDALVAEKVMGFKVLLTEGDVERESRKHMNGLAFKRNRDYPRDAGPWVVQGSTIDEMPPYSTDIAAAWPLWEKLTLRKNDLALQRDWNASDDWVVTEFNGDAREIYAYAATAPLAICRAALKAVQP